MHLKTIGLSSLQTGGDSGCQTGLKAHTGFPIMSPTFKRSLIIFLKVNTSIWLDTVWAETSRVCSVASTPIEPRG